MSEKSKQIDSLLTFQLSQQLNALGNTACLKQEVEMADFKKRIQSFEKLFRVYNPSKPNYNRYGLSLTSLNGEMTGIPDLDSLIEYNKKNRTNFKEGDFRKRTPAFRDFEELWDIMTPWHKYLGRSHILRLNEGGFFPPHRDSVRPLSFRLFISFALDPDIFVFLLDNKRVFFKQGALYFINTQLAHSVFSFSNKVDLVIFNVDLVKEAVDAVFNNLEIY